MARGSVSFFLLRGKGAATCRLYDASRGQARSRSTFGKRARSAASSQGVTCVADGIVIQREYSFGSGVAKPGGEWREDAKTLTRAERIKTGPERAYQGVCLVHSLGLSVFSFIGLATCHGKAQNESKPHSPHNALFSKGKGAQVLSIKPSRGVRSEI